MTQVQDDPFPLSDSLKELLDPESTREEKNYIVKAIKHNIQSTEILNVIVNTRLVKYNLRNLVGAMENKEHLVYPILPEETQLLYRNVKEMIIRVWRLYKTGNEKND